MMVAPRPPKLFVPDLLKGISSSKPQAYFSYAFHECCTACNDTDCRQTSEPPCYNCDDSAGAICLSFLRGDSFIDGSWIARIPILKLLMQMADSTH